jgi:hypothetical protein
MYKENERYTRAERAHEVVLQPRIRMNNACSTFLIGFPKRRHSKAKLEMNILVPHQR